MNTRRPERYPVREGPVKWQEQTPFIYNILINLLLYIFPGIGNQYQEYLEKLNDANLSDEERKYYEDAISFLESEELTGSNTEVKETALFTYEVTSDIDNEIRNFITSMAKIHFVTNFQSMKNVIRIRNSKKAVFNVRKK